MAPLCAVKFNTYLIEYFFVFLLNKKNRIKRVVLTVVISSEIWFIRSNKVSNVSVFCAQLKCINYINHTLGFPRLDINY